MKHAWSVVGSACPETLCNESNWQKYQQYGKAQPAWLLYICNLRPKPTCIMGIYEFYSHWNDIYLSLSLLLFPLFHFFPWQFHFHLSQKLRMGNVRRIVTTKLIITILNFFFFFCILFIGIVQAWAAENGMWQLMHYKPSLSGWQLIIMLPNYY